MGAVRPNAKSETKEKYVHCLTLMLILAATQANPTQPAQTEVRPLEEVLKTEKAPNGKHIKVRLHIEVLRGKRRGALHVKFIDVRPSPAVNIDIWDPKLRRIKPNTVLTVVGELHYGRVHSDARSIRYKVREISGRKYNDHRHWRTDRAIYILDPTYEIKALTRDDILTQKQKDVLADARKAAAAAKTPEEKKKIMAAAEKKVEQMMVGGQMNLLAMIEAAHCVRAHKEALDKILTDEQKKILSEARTAAAEAENPQEEQKILAAALGKVKGIMTDKQKGQLKQLRKAAGGANPSGKGDKEPAAEE